MAEEQEVVNNTNTTSSKFTISKVHVRPGKPFAFGQEADRWAHCMSTVPTIPDTPGKYKPMPYTFRLPPAPKSSKIGKVEARCPPFYLLLDHTIAVVWMIWSNSEDSTAPLGIGQLQWALAFLKTIHDKRGDHPPDVELSIDRIEEILLNKYAQLHDENMKLQKMNDSIRYADGAVYSKSLMVTKVPFSVNYDSMRRRLGADYSDIIDNATSITSADAADRLEQLKRSAGVDSLDQITDSALRDNAVKVLKAMHHRQTSKIVEQMKKLKDIEHKLKNVDDGDFQFMSPEQLQNIFNDDDDEGPEAHDCCEANNEQ